LNYNKKIKVRFFDLFLELENREDLVLNNLEGILKFRQIFLEIISTFAEKNLIESLDFLIEKI
jgi:hypothetical protein